MRRRDKAPFDFPYLRQTEYRPHILRDPADVEALQPVLRAMRRGTKASRLRQLDIACREHNRRLAEVYPTDAGPVLLGKGRLIDGRDGLGAVTLAEVEAYAHRSGVEAPDMVSVRFQCGRCTVSLELGWLRSVLKGDARRVVVSRTPR